MPYLTVRRFYRTKFEAWAHRCAPKLEKRARNLELSEEAFRAKWREIHFHYEGSLIRIAGLKGWDPYEHPNRKKRGRVGGFSAKARTRLMNLCACIRRDAKTLFVTLTYPREWSGNPDVWKRDLDAFGKWLRREFEKCSFVWKLEPQKRGAPHYHLLVWGIDYLHHQRLAQRWFEIVGSNDPAHLRAGTRVEAVRSRHGVMRYASKLYMGKDFTMPPGWEHVGRFWGVIGRSDLPLSKCYLRVEYLPTAFRFRRIVRHFLRSKGLRRSGNGSLRIFTEHHLQWARALDWAATGSCQPVDFSCCIFAQPF